MSWRELGGSEADRRGGRQLQPAAPASLSATSPTERGHISNKHRLRLFLFAATSPCVLLALY